MYILLLFKTFYLWGMCRKNESAVINLVIRNAVDYNFLSEILYK